MKPDNEPIIVDTDELTPPAIDDSLWKRRVGAYAIYDAPGTPKCSIYVQGYNRLHKTKYAVECVLKYTHDVDYELILVDNGSDDGTFEYFQSVQFENKKIIRITKNLGAGFPFEHVRRVFSGNYLVCVPNDVYVTKNWLSNLLKCYESDLRIGLVMPVSSNVSNLQQVDIEFSDFDDMQKKAEQYNVSDPAKWDERLRLITVLNIWPRYVLDTVGIADPAFLHDFMEDDIAARLRINGYKLILCKDTWICHDHDFRNLEDKDAAAFNNSLENGRATFKEKYHGLDAWDDIDNYERSLLSPIDKVALNTEEMSVLAIDPRCGTPILELRNRLRRRGIIDVYSNAFTTQAKYYSALQYAANEAQCDRIDFIQSYYAVGMFDIVVLCESLNTYSSPVSLLQSLCMFLAPGGLLLFKLRNTDNIQTLLRTVGFGNDNDEDLPSALPINEVFECMKLFGMQDISVVAAEALPHNEGERNKIQALLQTINEGAQDNDLIRLLTKDFIIKAVKG